MAWSRCAHRGGAGPGLFLGRWDLLRVPRLRYCRRGSALVRVARPRWQARELEPRPWRPRAAGDPPAGLAAG
eukprot:8665524-Heterocapsa_arctica.AAC.1